MSKYYAFSVEIHVSGIERAFDEVGLVIKINFDGNIDHYLKNCNVGLCGS